MPSIYYEFLNMSLSQPLDGFIIPFLGSLIRLKFKKKFTDDWKLQRRRESMHHSITHFF